MEASYRARNPRGNIVVTHARWAQAYVKTTSCLTPKLFRRITSIIQDYAVAVFATCRYYRSCKMKTVKKAVEVLNCFSHQEPELSVGELSRRLGVHKSIISRLVAALRSKRMLDQNPVTRKISIGVGAFRLGALFIKRFPLEQAASPHLSNLVERVQHSCHLAILDAHRVLTIASAESRQALRVILRTGEYRYLHATASGKLLLAYHAPLLLEEVIATTGLPAVTNKTVTSLSKLRRELISIRQNGIAWNFEESTRGAGACAAPLFDSQGLIIGAINTVYPLSAVNKSDFAAIATKVRAAGNVISNSMGWIGAAGSTLSRDISIARGARRGKTRVPTSANA